MRKDYIADKLTIDKDLDGLSLKMITEHFKLYEGYVKKSNEIQQKLEEADKSEANGVYSYIGELKRQETFAVNGMKLHEVYFGELNGSPSTSSGTIIETMIIEDFGSMDAWKLDMVATGLAARGWAILCYDFRDNKLHNYGADGHNVGAVWGAIPLIALDIYEHAYFMDYGVRRLDYIASFFKNLDWNYVNAIAEKFELQKQHSS
ncbi:MAG: Fe-Mn family superoxide dismutase [bacterium]|nr:Fe-Mn family superoxide dismutase [bacterium]